MKRFLITGTSLYNVNVGFSGAVALPTVCKKASLNKQAKKQKESNKKKKKIKIKTSFWSCSMLDM